MKNVMLRGLLALMCCGWAANGSAADLGGGTLTVAETELNFGRGPNTGINPSGDADLDICLDPLLACDTYALSVDLPADLIDFFPAASVELFIDWDSVSGQDDYDLFLYDESGKQIASSTSPGGPEFISFLANPGLAQFRVDVAHYLVAGTTYNTRITLDLGSPAADKTDEEVAAWLMANGGAAARDGELLASCQAPGVKLLADAVGDGGVAGVPVAGQDLVELHVYQTLDEHGGPLIAFELQVDDLSSLTPQTSYFVSFNTIYGDVRGVRMEVNDKGEASYFSYVVSEDSDGEKEGHFIAAGSEVPAHPMSGYASDGLISIFVRPEDLSLLLSHDTLQGFNAGIILFVGAEGAGLALNNDAMPDGLARAGEFEYLSQEECVAGETDSSARTLATAGRGGALGPLMPLMLLLLGLARRRR